MITRVYQKIGNVPTPMAGLALGIASIMWSWENFGDYHGVIQSLGAYIGVILLVCLLFKFVLHPKKLWNDLAHPVVGSVVPTFSMALMVVAATINHYSVGFSSVLWLIAVILHLLFLFFFTVHRARNFNLSDMVPSWFVPPIGIIVAAVAVPSNPLLLPLAQFLQYFGMLAYAIMLPAMLYRFIFSHSVPDEAKPTIAIMAAPGSLSLAGYLTVMNHPSPVIVALLFGVAISMTFLVYFAFFHLFKLPFSPGYSAFTFPMAIGATALFKLSNLLKNFDGLHQYFREVRILADIELFVASLVILYVAVRYLWHYVLRDLWRSMISVEPIH